MNEVEGESERVRESWGNKRHQKLLSAVSDDGI